MSHYTFISLFFFLLFLIPVHSYSQEKLNCYPVANEKLQSLPVTTMLQDSDGFMWFGSARGLYRYDGHRPYHYTHEGSSLFYQKIHGLFEDKQHNLWISEGENSLISYNLRTGRYKRYDFNHDIGLFTAFCHDWQGTLWAGTNKGFLYAFNNGAFVYDSTSHLRQNLEHAGGITALALVGNGEIWAGTARGGLYVFTPRNENTYKHFLSNKFITSIYSRPKSHKTWITTPDDVYVTENQHGDFNFKLKISRPQAGFNSIVPDEKKGVLIFGNTSRDFYKTMQEEVYAITLAQGSKVPEITGVQMAMNDNKGLLWIMAGTNLFTVPHKRFVPRVLKTWEANIPGGDNIMSFVEEKNNFFWVGAWERGIFLAENNGTIHRTINLPSDKIWTLARAGKNKLWAGTWDNGAFLVDTRTGNYQQVDTSNGLANNNVKCFLVEDSITWMGLWHDYGDKAGIYRYNMNSSKLQPVKLNRKSQEFDSFINCFYRDSRGILWIGTMKKGLFRLYSNNGAYRIEQFRHRMGKEGSLSNNFVTSILEDTGGNLWIGTENGGINKLSYPREKIEHFFLDKTLVGGMVRTMLEDKKGRIWLAGKGLTVIDTAGNILAGFSPYDGLQEKTFNHGASMTGSNGDFLFGGMAGFHVFNPDSILASLGKKDNIFITGISVNTSRLLPWVPNGSKRVLLKKVPNLTKKIDLKHDDKMLNIQFAVLDFFPGNNKTYTYYLHEFDKGTRWRVTSNNYVEYTDLQPGKYVFKVKGTNNHRIWSANTTTLVIHISPPFWQTSRFKTLLIIMVVLILWSLYKARGRSIKIRQIELEGQVQSRTKELQEKTEYLQTAYQEIEQQREQIEQLARKEKEANEMKLRFFTNVSHEFRTPLSLILAPIQQILKSEEFPEQVKNQLNIVLRNAGRLLHLVSEIMELRKLDTANMELNLSKVDLPRYIEEITSGFQVLATDKEITYRVRQNIRANAKGWVDTEKVDKIMLNLLSNAFKYTPHHGEITFEAFLYPALPEDVILPRKISEQVEDNKRHEQLLVMVSNTGKGIPPDELEHVFERFYHTSGNSRYTSGIGLSLAKRLVALHGGEIEAESGRETRTRFTFSLITQASAFPGARLLYEGLPPRGPFPTIEPWLVQEPRPRADTKTTGKKNKQGILVIEDNMDLLGFLEKSLSEDYRVYTAGNGKKGLETASKKLPEMVISDVMMPEMDGIALCNALKENVKTSHIAVILLTAKTSTENQLEGLRTGADDYLTKPFDLEILKQKIKNVIATRQQLVKKFNRQIKVEPSEITVTKPDEIFIRKVVELIENNLNNKALDVWFLVESMNMSRAAFYNKIKAITGKTPNEFIINIRLKRAMQFFKQGEKIISGVAYKVGFNSPVHFSIRFKKEFNIAPAEFIRKNSPSNLE